MTDTPTEDGSEGIWAKLRRRKVVQWGIVYVAFAWGLLQGIGFVADAFAWPAAAKQIATLVLLIRATGRARARLVPRRPGSAAGDGNRADHTHAAVPAGWRLPLAVPAWQRLNDTSDTGRR